MANETIVVWGSTKTLEANGASIANNAIGQADDANYSIDTDGGSYPDAIFVFSCSFSVAPTEGANIMLLAQPIMTDGTAQAPEVGRPVEFVGYFTVDNVTTTQYMRCLARDLPRQANYFLQNAGTGQAISAGWTLKVTPRTYAPKP